MAFGEKNPSHTDPYFGMDSKVGGLCYVSFSGGKDSTVLLDLARRVDTTIPAVFIDTGLEYPEIRQFALSQENVVRVKPEMNFRKVIEVYGYPIISKDVAKTVCYAQKYNETDGKQGKWAIEALSGTYVNKSGDLSIYNCPKYQYLLDAPFKVSSACCDVMKKRTAHKYERESNRKPIIATMACESRNRRRLWLETGCNVFGARNPASKPLSFWTEQDVLEYLQKFNIPYCSVYGEIKQDKMGKYYTTGASRTGCVFCGFGCHLEKEPNRFQRLKETHPQLWEYCMKPWDEGGLGMQGVLDFIGVKYE